MALRPYDDPFARRHTTGSATSGFEGGRLVDPFAMMDETMMGDMMMPFVNRRRAGGMGMDMGGLFGQMDDMMSMMHAMPPGGGGGSSMMMSSSGGGGSFSSQQMVFSSTVGEDGNVHTEQFSSSTIGDRGRGVRETQQAYTNSREGVDKMSLERQLGEHGRKMVKERYRASGEERQTDMFRGITEDQVHEFDARWQREAAPHIPRHQIPTRQMVTGGNLGVPCGGSDASVARGHPRYDVASGGYPTEYRRALPVAQTYVGRTEPAQAATFTVGSSQVYRSAPSSYGGYQPRYW